MKARIIRIGNSRGVRIPKALLEHAGLEDEVLLRLVEGRIVLDPVSRVRTGWAEAARELSQREGGRLLDEPVPTRFDKAEWSWE